MSIIKEKNTVSKKQSITDKETLITGIMTFYGNKFPKVLKEKRKQKKENFFVYSFYSALIVLFITMFTTAYNNNNQTHAEEGVITVYKSPTCGCCKNWISHLEDSDLVKEMGFKVKAIDSANMSLIKDKNGVPSGARSCHTAVINDYVIEGHVPAADIKRLLKEKRNVSGLAVPGMPMGSPGMEGNRVDKYSVYEFDKQGKARVINQY